MTDPLIATLSQVTSPDIVKGELADRLQWAGDASIYHLIPRVVVLARDGLDVQIILRIAQQFKVKVCFRAGGTSLSGQAVTDGILIVVSRYMRNITVSDDASMVTCEPGAVGSWVNAALAPHHKRIGPDPASIQAAEIGGIIANNASGMCCGVHENSYQTVTSMDVTLANGFRFDTGADDANDLLQEHEADLYEGLLALRDQIRKDETLAEQITTAFKTKNTVGYSLNAFIDEDEPAQILQKLIVGSEGTLAFINKATFRCIDLPSHKATALLLFSSVEAAGAAVDLLAQSGATMMAQLARRCSTTTPSCRMECMAVTAWVVMAARAATRGSIAWLQTTTATRRARAPTCVGRACASRGHVTLMVTFWGPGVAATIP